MERTIMLKLLISLSLLNFVFSAKFSPGIADVSTNGKTTGEQDIELRLASTEKLVLQLLGRVEEQQGQIADLNVQLAAERRRTSSLEKTVEQLASKISISNNDVAETDDSDNSLESEDVVHTDVSQTGRRIRRADNEMTVAFFATLTDHVTHAGVHQILLFDNVVTNLGNSYNGHNGSFLAPVSGTYVFSVTIMSLYHTNGHFEYRKNGQFVSRMYVSGGEGGYDTTSQTIILQLQKGDDLTIHNIDPDVSLAGIHFSSFAGFLLQEDFSGATVVVGK